MGRDNFEGEGASIVKYRHAAVSCAIKSSVIAKMGDRLATINMGRKVGGGVLCSFPWGEAWSPYNTYNVT